MLDPRKTQTQIRIAITAVATLCWHALVLRRPADRTLAAYLREHAGFGGRDRRLVTDLVFAVFRWWGWLEPLAPALFRERVLAAEPGLGVTVPEDVLAAEWLPLLFAAAVVERLEYPDLLRQAAPVCGVSLEDLDAILGEPEPAQRAARFFAARTLPGAGPAPIPPAALVPETLVPAWALAEAGEAVAPGKLIHWLQRRPPLWLRVQQGESDTVVAELRAAGLQAEPHGQLARAVRLGTPRLNLHAVAAYSEGRVEVQDLASQAIGHVCGPRPGERWWDACAGAGGKALLLAQLMEGKGTVVATDVREYKLDDLRKRARRANAFNITARAWDGQPLPARKATFDGVLVDVPCSCSGTWRRNPAARWGTSAAEIAELAELQGQILAAAASGVKPGGVLVYATCSMFTRENAGVVSAFLETQPGFALEPFAHPLTGAPVTAGMLQIWPWDGDCDAMFAARMRRTV